MRQYNETASFRKGHKPFMRVVRHGWVLIIIFLGLLPVGCPNEQPDGINSPQNRQVPQRIVSFAPNITETVFALGCGDRLVGVTDFCDFPAETAAIRKVGGHINPDLEAVAVLRPDLIIIQGLHEKVAQFAELHQIPLVRVNMDTLATIDDGIRIIGEELGCVEKADALRTQVRQELDEVKRRVANLSRPRVLIITSRQSHDMNNLYTLGGGSFVSELVANAGGENIFHDAPQAYMEASKESVVMRAPEVILEFHAGEKLSAEDQERYRSDWQAFSTLPAVQSNRIYLIMESHALRPGPRVGEVARILARCLHPEAFAESPTP